MYLKKHSAGLITPPCMNSPWSGIYVIKTHRIRPHLVSKMHPNISDDIIVFGTDEEEHLRNIDTIFGRLSITKLKVSH